MRRFWQILFWLVFKLRLYFIWSSIYRRIFEASYRQQHYQIPVYPDLKTIEIHIGKMRWRRDPWFALFDAISYPQTAWIKLLLDIPVGDCDDISIAAAAAYERWLHRYGNTSSEYSATNLSLPLMVSVIWIDKWLAKGHNICIFSYVSQQDKKAYWAYWSNWYQGRIRWGFANILDIVHDVHSQAIAAAVWKPTMELLEVHLLPRRA